MRGGGGAGEGGGVKSTPLPPKQIGVNGKTISYKLRLSKLLDNLSEIYSKNYGDKNYKSECEFKSIKNKNNFFIIAKSSEKTGKTNK